MFVSPMRVPELYHGANVSIQAHGQYRCYGIDLHGHGLATPVAAARAASAVHAVYLA